jgi:hypothetical protein
VRLPLLRKASRRHRHHSSNKLSLRARDKLSRKANIKISSQCVPAFQCLVVADVEEVELMSLQASVPPVALKRAHRAMLAVEAEVDVEVDAVA